MQSSPPCRRRVIAAVEQTTWFDELKRRRVFRAFTLVLAWASTSRAAASRARGRRAGAGFWPSSHSRVNARLVSSEGYELWSDKFERGVDNAFAIQEEDPRPPADLTLRR